MARPAGTRSSSAATRPAAARKQQRKDKRAASKARRAAHHVEMHPPRREGADAGADGDAAAGASRKRKRGNDEEDDDGWVPRPVASNPLPPSIAFANPEDEEIAYLEKKLGLVADTKAARKNRKRLEKELLEDGFNDDILEFLDVLDKGESIAEFDKKVSRRERSKERGRYADEAGPVEEEEEEQEQDQEQQEERAVKRASRGKAKEQGADGSGGSDEDELSAGEVEEGSGDDERDDERDEGQEEEAEQDEDEDDEGREDAEASGGDEEDDGADELEEGVTYLPKQDLYGKSLKKRPAPASDAPSSGKKALLGGMDKEALRVRKFVNGLMNRLTEGSVAPVAGELARHYRETPRAVLDEAVSLAILSGLRSDTVLLGALACTFAALTAALTVLAPGGNFGAYMLEKAALAFERARAEDGEGVFHADVGEALVGKRAANVAALVAHLFALGVTTSGVVFDLLDREAARLSAASVDVVTAVVHECGARLRKDDPARLAALTRALQAAQEAQGGGSARTAALLEQVYALKNNKKAAVEAVEERARRLNKALRALEQQQGAETRHALKLGWDELLHAEERGRWWVVGGVWKDQDAVLAQAKEGGGGGGGGALEGHRMLAGMGGGGGRVAQALARASSQLLLAARKQRMNTDVRRAVFCEMMDSESAGDAMERLNSLNLAEKQQREIVHVLVKCCSASRDYNVFFEQLALQLCAFRASFRFSLQLAFWDIFTSLNTLKPRKLAHFSTLLAHLVLKDALPLTVLKHVDFAAMRDEGDVAFFKAFFRDLLCYGGEGKEGARVVARAFNRTGASPDFIDLADGMQLFLKMQLDASADETLLLKRAKIAHRVLDALAVAREAYTEPGADEADDTML
jgi:nucleolar MIF4G domain-containing protein 1